MNREWVDVLELSGLFVLLFVLAELLYRVLKIKGAYIRQLVHTGMGLLALLFPLVFEDVWQAAVVCGVLLVVLTAGFYLKALPSVNEAGRGSRGSFLYPLTVVLVFSFYYSLPVSRLHFGKYLFFFLPMLVLAKPAASLAGRYYRQRQEEPEEGKTAVGSLVFFVVALALCLVLFFVFRKPGTGIARMSVEGFFIAAATTAIERYSKRGWGTFTVPLVAMGLLLLFERIQS